MTPLLTAALTTVLLSTPAWSAPAPSAPTAAPAVSGAVSGTAAASAAAQGACSTPAERGFRPTSLRTLGGSFPVLGLGASPSGVPRTPPISAKGKRQVAWENGRTRPGAKRGHVLLNVHAWPDGSALGNLFSRELDEGDIVQVSGPAGTLCYEVSKRVQARPGPKLARTYFGTKRSSHKLAIVTCSGKRLGPGHWSQRTVWLAKPVR